MSKTKNKYSLYIVKNSKGWIVGYLSNKDIEQGLDTTLDLQGYEIIAL